MNGMRKSPLWHDHKDDIWNYVHRGLVSFVMAAKAFSDQPLFEKIRKYKEYFEPSEPQ